MVSENARIEHALWTAEDFLDWLEPGVHADLIDGEKFKHSPVSLPHADLLNFLDRLLAAYLEKSGVGGKLYREVVAVRLSSRNVFLPDLSWFAPDQVASLAETYAPVAPRWVCEALSARTANRDVGPKFAAYEEHGVNEYWVLDPRTLAHRFYAREGEILVEFANGEDLISSRVLPGFFVRREWLNPAALPAVADCLAELG